MGACLVCVLLRFVRRRVICVCVCVCVCACVCGGTYDEEADGRVNLQHTPLHRDANDHDQDEQEDLLLCVLLFECLLVGVLA